MSSPATRHFRSYRPLRSRIGKHANVLSRAGFQITDGSDSGWFGDGRYILANGTQLLRITRSRGEEFLEVAWTRSPAEENWFDLNEVMVAFGAITFDEVVSKHALPHDLDFKMAAYFKLHPTIASELAHDRAGLEERLRSVRRRAMEYAQEKYGRKARS